MKYLIVLVVVACAIGFSQVGYSMKHACSYLKFQYSIVWLLQCDISEDMRKRMFEQMTRHCAKKESGTEDDIQGILALKPTDTATSKCMQACIGEASGVVSPISN